MARMRTLVLLSSVLLSVSCLNAAPLPEQYRDQYVEEFNTPFAEQSIRFGDIDNLGFRTLWSFDPYTGETLAHPFPWSPQPEDLYSTDRILVPSSYISAVEIDGYTNSGPGYWSRPRDIVLTFTPPKYKISSAVLQIFADDFQAPYWGSKFQVLFNGERVEELEEIINSLRQTGPIGKLLSFTVPERFFPSLVLGKMVVNIDDPTTGRGDGFAFDFFRLVINPKPGFNRGKLSGTVVEAATGRPIAGAVLYIDGEFSETASDAAGRYAFEAVPPGLANVRAFSPGYIAQIRHVDVLLNQTTALDFRLAPDGRNDLAGGKIRKIEGGAAGDVISFEEIIFYADSDHIKPESFAVLDGIAQAILKRAPGVIEIAGHTNATGRPEAEQRLSVMRAQQVAAYLVRRGVPSARLRSRGYGSSRLKESKISEANRRVEFKILDQ